MANFATYLSLVNLPVEVHQIISSYLQDTNALLNFHASCTKLWQMIHQVVVYPSGVPVSFLVLGERFYVTLSYTSKIGSPKKNVSNYKIPMRGGNYQIGGPSYSEDKDVWTFWYKLRIDPKSLLVNTADYTFTKSTGLCHHLHGAMNQVPFATAMGCNAPKDEDGRANIDLRGTNLQVDDVFRHDGWKSAGTWIFSENNQIVQISGGGFCGWVCPAKGHEGGGWHLQLKVVEQPEKNGGCILN